MMCAILQSNYIPWRGYFDLINDVDLFVFYDEVKYTKSDWRNRNIIYTKDGLKWLTLSCGRDFKLKINEVKISVDKNWQEEHYKNICDTYSGTPYFHKIVPFLEHVYIDSNWEYLSDLNQFIIRHIAREILGINTTFANSMDYFSTGQKNEKLLSLIRSTGATHYLSGPTAKDYLDETAFNNEGITVHWKDYSGYPSYRQTREPFEGGVSIIDLLANTGDDAPYYIWGWREDYKEEQ